MSAALPNGGQLEAEGGAIPLHSRFYIERPVDGDFRTAVRRGDSILLVKGPRQVGKTSLLARGLQEARAAGARVTLTDFQTLGPHHLESAEALCLGLGTMLADHLDLEVYPDEVWEPGRGANANFSRYVAREVLEGSPAALVWGLDEVDRLFPTPFSDEIFAMFRGWHNKRALEPESPWGRLTLAISFATEAHLFIRDLNQSPFNVGTRVTLRDFTLEEVADLNARYGSPLRGGEELARFHALLGGHPFLTRRGLHELAAGGMGLDALEAVADREEGPFGDHLRRMLVLLVRDPELRGVLGEFLQEGRPLPEKSFYRLRGAGVLSGECAERAAPRCQLYERYLNRSLV